MLLDIREIQHVTALGRFRNFARAAESLGISQPALSKSIRAIERALEVRLFERSRRGVTPTAFGEVILAGSVPVLRSVDDVLGELRRLKGLEEGTVRVGAGAFALELSVATVALRLASRHPALQLRVVEGDWETLTRDVIAGSLDVVVAEVTAAEQEPALSVERVGERGGVFYCRAGHPLLSRARTVFADVLAFPLAMNPLPGRLAPHLERAEAAGRFDPASGHFLPAIALDSVSLMKRAVLETDAVSWAPEILIASELRAGSFVALPVATPWARLNYGIIRRADRPVMPAVEMFLTELREEEKRIAAGASSRRRRGRTARTSK